MAPPVTSGLIVHHDAQAITGIADGGSLQQWNDLVTGHHLTQATLAKRPVYIASGHNGHPVVRFTAADVSFMQVAWGGAWSQPNTIFLVASHGGQAGGVVLDGRNQFDRHALGASGAATTDLMMFAGSIGPTDPVNPPHPVRVWTLVYDGASSVLRRDQAQVATGNVGANNLGGLSVGGRYSDERYRDADVCEILFYNRRLTAQEIADTEDYLATRWAAGGTALSGASETVTDGSGALTVTTALAGTSGTVTDGSGDLTITAAGTTLSGTSETVTDGTGDLTTTGTVTALAGTSVTVTGGQGELSVAGSTADWIPAYVWTGSGGWQPMFNTAGTPHA